MEREDITEGMRVRIDGYGEPGFVSAKDRTLNSQTGTVVPSESLYYIAVRLDTPSSFHDGLERVLCAPNELTEID